MVVPQTSNLTDTIKDFLQNNIKPLEEYLVNRLERGITTYLAGEDERTFPK